MFNVLKYREMDILQILMARFTYQFDENLIKKRKMTE
jgi:hypothetical protein